jgi:hypothetical protein
MIHVTIYSRNYISNQQGSQFADNTVVGIMVVFPVLTVMALLVTGKIDQATMSKTFEGFWTALPALAGKKSEQSEKQDNNELPPADEK